MVEMFVKKLVFPEADSEITYNINATVNKTKETIKPKTVDKLIVRTYLHQLFLPIVALSRNVMRDMIFTPITQSRIN
jgi:hypothetical protein